MEFKGALQRYRSTGTEVTTRGNYIDGSEAPNSRGKPQLLGFTWVWRFCLRVANIGGPSPTPPTSCPKVIEMIKF